MDPYRRPMRVPPPVMAAPGLLSLRPSPAGPCQPEFRRTWRQWQCDLQQASHFRHTDFGQIGIRRIFPPPLGGLKPAKRGPS
jgi:hypothetical protein